MKEGKERSYFWGRNNMICSAKERDKWKYGSLRFSV
jgi:hypothetical protein